MSFRTVVISSTCKLDVQFGYMVVRQVNETRRVFLNEIDIVIIENPACTVTGCLLAELAKNNIGVVLCDETHSPLAELLLLYGHSDSPRKLWEQLEWKAKNTGEVWTQIIKEKIHQQALFLRELGYDDSTMMLEHYVDEICFRDSTNREGHAAKVYFNAVFGMGFERMRDNADTINSALNYGYAVILAAFSREIVACGYDTRLGIGHCNTFNSFNLSCDLMEPYRILIDRVVKKNDFQSFDTSEKHKMLEIFNLELNIGGTKQTLLNSIRIYTRSIFRAIATGCVDDLKFCDFGDK